MKYAKIITVVTILLSISCSAFAWKNGPSGNAAVNSPSDVCFPPPFGTHDWIAKYAIGALPEEESVWLLPHVDMYLLGTEAPDNSKIPARCGAPHNGYGDTGGGHSIEWNDDYSSMIKDRPAIRAQEEYDRAVAAYRSGDRKAAAYYLGACAHYVGDVSSYPHSMGGEKNHNAYEGWVRTATDSEDGGYFDQYVSYDSLVRRNPGTAAKRISRLVAEGTESILSAKQMDTMYPLQSDSLEYLDSVGMSLNLGVNEFADVLHTFWLNVVQE